MPIEAERLIQVIRQAMPPNAEVQIAPGIADITVGVAWRLGDDPERPNKMSKTISIHVTHEAAQDFESATEADQANAYARVHRFIEVQLAGFDPNHDTPRYESPPVVRWFITSSVLLG